MQYISGDLLDLRVQLWKYNIYIKFNVFEQPNKMSKWKVRISLLELGEQISWQMILQITSYHYVYIFCSVWYHVIQLLELF